ncbi:Crp/Fnr family transcriptional regulator [Pasteurellaceae bacterium HPA106]|uniref:Crp/Fnr family transcriptional regulator n=1 Tax=Spirabiliibacterium pneumoniae TaxID=221400 RepID=UPI001AAD3AF5|nr:Crp/Fnr family transcriptional regulator [Spirabiliibacterium pneumoniae]MBE2896888.1 Crp/Fnr family transcriptional regulator [Spirabiliibacterium pneumoniae]
MNIICRHCLEDMMASRKMITMLKTLDIHQGHPCLSEVSLFQDVPEEEMRELNARLPLKHVSAGELIYTPHYHHHALFIIKAGRVRVFQTSAQGKALTIAILEKGSVFGSLPLLGQRMGNNYAEAMEDSLICQLNEAQIAQHFLSDQRIAVRVAKILGERVNELEERLADFVFKPLPQRLAGLLLKLATTSSLPLGTKKHIVSLTHEQLGSLVGATREAVSKILSSFVQAGLIAQTRGKIILLSQEGLKRLSQSDIFN